jgi:hypothetical protein
MLQVDYSELARVKLNKLLHKHPDFEALLHNVLEQDPRPAYKSGMQDEKTYSVLLYSYDVKWQVREAINYVVDIEAK